MIAAENHKIQTLGEFAGTIASTFVLPLVFLFVDYAFRSQSSLATFEELALQSGPDCCIFSLGATGAIFMDPHVKAIPGLGSSTCALLVVAVVFILRFYCVGAARKKNPRRSLALGLASIFLMVIVPTVAFIAEKYL